MPWRLATGASLLRWVVLPLALAGELRKRPLADYTVVAYRVLGPAPGR